MRLFHVVMGTCGLVIVLSNAQGQSVSRQPGSSARQAVTGPSEPINRAIAAGATTIITMQPVAPKTVPASNYPMGSSIMGQTLTLGSVPARVWFELHATNWGSDVFRVMVARIDATDADGDGGGYDGDTADCGGSPVAGAGDLLPAMQACDVNADCRSTISGISSACSNGEPSRCVTWDGVIPGDYFPPGRWCEPAFQNKCDPRWILTDIAGTPIVDLSTLNTQIAGCPDLGEIATDFAPSYLGTLVLDVPADAKGSYTIDFDDVYSFMNLEGGAIIPIAALNPGIIKIACGACCTNLGPGTTICYDGVSKTECAALPGQPSLFHRDAMCKSGDACATCTSNSVCDDNSSCTVDLCQDFFCTNTPVHDWNPATECCDPMSGVQSLIPASTPCRIGGCSLGGSSGSPTFTNLPDGAECISQDRCDMPGECASGVCNGDEYAGSNCPKARFISFDIDTGATASAYRVRLVSLHHPVPPYSGGLASDFSAYEGEYRWVGDATSYVESTTNPTEVHSAELSCDPFYRDWSAIDLLHVTGSAVVPSSVYELQSIAQGLDINEESNYSAPITLVTGRWGDVVYPYNPPSTTVQPDATDHAALADKFRSLMGSVSKPRALLAGEGMTDVPGLSLDVNFAEISACLDAFRGRPYPYGGPTPCP